MKNERFKGRSSLEVITAGIANSALIMRLQSRLKSRLASFDPKRLRRWCFLMMAVLLVGDVLVCLRAGRPSRAAPAFSVIRPVSVSGAPERHPAGKAFGPVWDSLMADPALQRGWDSLLQSRPGLRDTVRRLQRLDSAALGR